MWKLTLYGLLIISALSFAQVQVTETSIYNTAEQMLLANEINESGEPFAEYLGYNLDDLDPNVLDVPDSISYTLGIENYEYSRYQLGTIISRSGMGLHMLWAPVIGQMAAMEPDEFDGSMTGTPNGYKEDDELMKNIMHFSMLAKHMPPGNPWPQFADFMSADPHLPQPVDAEKFVWQDFSTLRWDRNKMDKILNPAAMGQSLMKQYLWAQDMLSAFHDSTEEGIDPDGIVSPDMPDSHQFDPSNNVYYGGDGLDGFVGMVLTAEAINKIKFTTTKLAYNGSELGMVDLMTYNPQNGLQYFPHKIQVTEEMVAAGLPPRASELTVIDASSDLFDQFSILWGTLNFANMMDPNNSTDGAHMAYHTVFDGDPFPAAMSQTGSAGPFDLMKGTAKAVFQNILAMHFNAEEGTFVDSSELIGGVVQQGNYISTVNAGYIIVGLQKVIQEFAGTPLEQMARDALNKQAQFILNKLKNGEGTFAKGYTIGTGADTGAILVVSQASAVRGLSAATQVTSEQSYLDGAKDAYAHLISDFYIAGQHAFLSELGNSVATYTPFSFAVIAGALREASLVTNAEDAPAIYTRFFKKVAQAMQLSEGAATGESGNDSDNDGVPYIPQQPDGLPPVFAGEATLDLGTTGVSDRNSVLSNFVLEQNYPNPFNPTTTINFSVKEPGFYSLDVYNINGEKVKSLVHGQLAQQNYSITFDAKGLSSGIYYYQLKGYGESQIKKLTLLR